MESLNIFEFYCVINFFFIVGKDRLLDVMVLLVFFLEVNCIMDCWYKCIRCFQFIGVVDELQVSLKFKLWCQGYFVEDFIGCFGIVGEWCIEIIVKVDV